MSLSSLVAIPDLISNKNRIQQIVIPDIKRIDNVREFMSDTTNFNGNIKTLTNRLDGETQECQNIIQFLKLEVRQKKASLQSLKKDILNLKHQLNLPNANERFLVKKEKVSLKSPDGKRTNEYDVTTALDSFSVQMASLYGMIVVLDSDIDEVNYLKSVALNNSNCVKLWYQKTQHNNKIKHNDGDSK